MWTRGVCGSVRQAVLEYLCRVQCVRSMGCETLLNGGYSIWVAGHAAQVLAYGVSSGSWQYGDTYVQNTSFADL